MEAPSSTGRESKTLLSSWAQNGQRISKALQHLGQSDSISLHVVCQCRISSDFCPESRGVWMPPGGKAAGHGSPRTKASLQREIPAPGAGIGPPEPEPA